MILLSVESIFILSVIEKIFLLEILDAITSEVFSRPDDFWITQLQATHYNCSKQNNLRQFFLTLLEKCNQAPTEIEKTRTFASVFFRAKAKKVKAFRCSTAIQKTRVFCAQGAYDKCYRSDRVNWHTNSLTLPKELDPDKCKKN